MSSNENFSVAAKKSPTMLMGTSQTRVLRHFYLTHNERLTPEEHDSLIDWLSKLDVHVKYMNRDFTDAVQMAQLVHQLYPKLVQLNNYPNRSNTKLKLANWETFNYKVLRRLNLKLPDKVLLQLVNGDAVLTELLLYDLMQYELRRQEKCVVEENLQEQIWLANNEVMDVDITMKVGDALVRAPQRMILFSIYEQSQRKMANTNQELQLLQKKCSHMEKLLLLKDERIKQLSMQINHMQSRGEGSTGICNNGSDSSNSN